MRLWQLHTTHLPHDATLHAYIAIIQACMACNMCRAQRMTGVTGVSHLLQRAHHPMQHARQHKMGRVPPVRVWAPLPTQVTAGVQNLHDVGASEQLAPKQSLRKNGADGPHVNFWAIRHLGMP